MRAAAITNGLRLYIFERGYLVATKVPFVTASGEHVAVSATLADRCYLVDHPEGLLLWDTGLSDALIDEPDGLVFGRWRFVVTRTLTSFLDELHLAPDDIDYLGFSHLHLDHAGNAARFAGSTVLVNAKEYAAAFAPGVPLAYSPPTYAALQESRIIRTDDDYDVFGDGSALILAAPGHSAGHQVLLLDLPRTGPLLLAGDLYYAERDRRERRFPAWNDDHKATLRSMARVERLIARTGAGLIIHHDRTASDQLPRPPAYLE